MWSRGPNGEGSPRWGRGASQQVAEKTGTCGPVLAARGPARGPGKKPDFHVRVTERSQKAR